MKKAGLLLLFILTNSVLVDAQEKYHFTVDAKHDTIAVYDTRDNVVLLYGKDVFVYQQTPIKVIKDRKKIIFSSPIGELGKVSSNKYRKIYLTNGSMYILSSGKRKLSYKKDGQVCASAEYSYNGSYPYVMSDRIDVEMNIDTDLDVIPFLFQSVIAHIQGTREAERLSFLSSFSLLFP
jgi:hypothetical protein